MAESIILSKIDFAITIYGNYLQQFHCKRLQKLVISTKFQKIPQKTILAINPGKHGKDFANKVSKDFNKLPIKIRQSDEMY